MFFAFFSHVKIIVFYLWMMYFEYVWLNCIFSLIVVESWKILFLGFQFFFLWISYISLHLLENWYFEYLQFEYLVGLQADLFFVLLWWVFLEGFGNGLIFIWFSELQELVEIVVILLCWFLCSSVTFGRWWKLNYITLEWGKVLVGDQAFKRSANHLFKNVCEAARLRILLDQNDVRKLRKQHWFQRRKKKRKEKLDAKKMEETVLHAFAWTQ
jgi:hypothetical protein